MHFWIDKRSQCGYSGRRVPASLSTGVGRTRRDRHLKPMVTPVHRFQSVECVAGAARRPPGLTPHLHLPPPSMHRPHHFHHPTVAHHNNSTPRVVNNGSNLATATVGSGGGGGTGAVELNSSVFLDVSLRGESAPPPLPHHVMPTHLKCGMWASFALATIFVACAKLYFDHQILYEQGASVEVIVLCGLLSVFLLAACIVSLCRVRAYPLLPAAPHPPNTSIEDPPSQASSDDLILGTILSIEAAVSAASAQPARVEPTPPPPPYHIAVLLPQREAPPPSYEKAVS